MADMTPKEIESKIDELTKRSEAVSRRKATLGGQLTEKKEQLASLIKEIRDAGYDPKTLPAERDRLQKELVADLETFEKKLAEVETAIGQFDSGAKK